MEGTLAQLNEGLSASQANTNYHTFISIGDIEEPGIIVPQKEYVTVLTNPGFTPNPPVKFSQDGRPLYCKDALGPEFRQRAGESMYGNVALEESFANCGAKAAIRIEWPGCQSWFKTIGVERSVDGECVKISKTDLAPKIAGAVKDFFFKPQGSFLKDSTWSQDCNTHWWPHARIRFDQLILYELRHVSHGSFQPVLLADIDGVAPPTIEGDNHLGPDLEQFAVFEDSGVLVAEPEMTIDNVR